MLTPVATPARVADQHTAHVRATCEFLVTAVSCLDTPRIELGTVRSLLVSMHECADTERRQLGDLSRRAGRITAPFECYGRSLLRVDAIVLDIISGDFWGCCPLPQAAILRLRESLVDVLEASSGDP